MSHTETHIGRAVRLEMPEDKEVWAENTLKELKAERDDYYDSAFEQVTEDGKHYLLIAGQLYAIENKELGEGEDINNAVVNPDGSISYVLQFYNGGCYFTEALEDLIETVSS